MSLDLASIREDYSKKELSPKDCLPDGVAQLELWVKEAIESKALEPTAVNIATVNTDGRPSSRVVLLKGIEHGQLLFFTNYDSRKGHDIDANPHVAATFFWQELERQVRVEGTIAKVSAERSDEYFITRPYTSRVGAWASPQSQEIPNKAEIVKRAAMYGVKFPFKVPRPPHWGGYAITPERIEFWQGRPSRLHDRVLYTRQADGSWQRARLAP